MTALTAKTTIDARRWRVPRIDRRPRVIRVGAGAGARQTAILALRGMLVFRRSPQLLFDAALLPVVGPMLFGNVFGTALAGSVRAYLPALIPGVLVQIMLTASVVTGVQLCEDIKSGVHDRFASMPIARLAPIAGTLAAGVTRYVLATAMVVIVGLAMGYRPTHPIGLMTGAALVIFVTAVLSWIFATVGVLVPKPTAVQGISSLILMLLTVVSNALVPISAMSPVLRRFAEINPVSHLVSAVRTLADHGRFGADAGWSMVGVVAVVAVLAPVTLWALRPH
ncbi:ABC transporter permease [Nocardia terpenica]|uniref:Transport permease protein n=1 Tax=Nocardia terpenica TaxID=455432 RepID=A0A291RPZ5_9NOCA|nr:ABC transporter permease [Nocardia terpenica]ATL69242.1 ABC transporter [Nocardia terpenica]